MERLAGPDPVISVELRPPRSGLSSMESMDVWIDLHQSLRRLDRGGHPIFITDNAVAVKEEENLAHLTGNLPEDVQRARISPFLTSKHTLEYCLMYASRARTAGFEALTVLGGDRFAGPPRCVPRAYMLRELIRDAVPDLALGGWLNPARDPEEQLGYAMRDTYTADFVLTQVVSHHSLDRVDALLEAAERLGFTLPLVWGVFFYRSANPTTLDRLAEYFPVPARHLTEEFGAGDAAEEICARTIRALAAVGAKNIYVSNLGFRRVDRRLGQVLAAL